MALMDRLARILAEQKKNVCVYLIGDYTKCTRENKAQLKMLDAYGLQSLQNCPENPEIVYVDALLESVVAANRRSGSSGDT